MSLRGLRLQTLFVISLGSLLALRVFAAPRKFVGQVEATNGVAIGGWPARSHDALFSGDRVATSTDATALVKFSAFSQTSVLQQSSIRFQRDAAGRALAEVSSGMALTTTAGRKDLIIETAKYRVQPVEEKRTIYLVALLPDKSTLIAARQGDISITDIRSRKRYQLTSGRYIVFEASAAGLPGQEEEKNKEAPGKPAGQATPPPAPPSKPQPQPPPKPVKQPWHIGSLSHSASIAVILAAAGGAAGAVGIAAGGGGHSASPSTP
jgi:hypothetical protein